MLNFNSKIVTIGALILILFLIYNSLKSYKPSVNVNYNNNPAQYSVDIDANRNNFTWYEKVILYFSRDKVKRYKEVESGEESSEQGTNRNQSAQEKRE